MELILFIANNVFPVFLIIGLGFALRKINLINANFCTIANQLIFMVALPAFIFAEMLKMDVRKAFDFNLIGYVYLGTFATVFLAWITGKILKAKDSDFGAFIQGSYRGNLAIIGLALIGNVGGNIALGKAAIVLAFVMPLYCNCCAFILQHFFQCRNVQKSIKRHRCQSAYDSIGFGVCLFLSKNITSCHCADDS